MCQKYSGERNSKETSISQFPPLHCSDMFLKMLDPIPPPLLPKARSRRWAFLQCVEVFRTKTLSRRACHLAHTGISMRGRGETVEWNSSRAVRSFTEKLTSQQHDQHVNARRAAADWSRQLRRRALLEMKRALCQSTVTSCPLSLQKKSVLPNDYKKTKIQNICDKGSLSN